MPIDDRTTNRSYKLPNAGNFLADDVQRLRDALTAIDADVFARYTKAETDQKLADLINGAPGALDTLQELAASLGNDANFAATITNALAGKPGFADVWTRTQADARYVQGVTQTENVFTGTGSQTTFTLTQTPPTRESLLVTVDGVVQPTTAYNLSGSALILSEAPASGASIRVLMLGVAGPVQSASTLNFTQAGTGAVTRTVDSKLKDVVSVKDFGAKGDGSWDDTAAIQAAVATGKSVQVGPGGTYMVTGNVQVTTSGQKIWGDGTIKKLGTTQQALISLADGVSNVSFDGLTFDGNRSLFSVGNPVPAIFGHVNSSVSVTNCAFQNIIDCGIKLRDSAGLTAIGNRFTNIGQNGIELRVYTNDPRTGNPYPSRPTVNGNHRIIGNHFSRIDDGLSGAGDGCGVTFDSTAASYPIVSTVVSDNTFEDVLRSIWTENNVAGSEAQNVVVKGNTIRGNLAGAGTVQTKDGIGLIGVKGAVVEGNTILNVGNFTPVGGNCAGVQVSIASTRDVVIANNVIQDLTGNAVRTDYCINVAAGERIVIKNNITRGASDGQIRLVTAVTNQVEISGNLGAEDEYSWGQPVSLAFTRQNIPANTTTIYFYPFGWTDDTDFIMPSVGKLVGMSVKLSSAISAGTITITPYAGATALTNLSVTNADFGGGTVAYKKVESINATLVGLNTRISVRATTDASFAPATTDALVILIFDASVKD